MMLISVIPIFWWWRVKKVSIKYFIFGGVLWIIAITPKVLMDLTVTPSLRNYALGYGTEVFVVITGLYVGLRTGLFESGFTYIAGLKTKLRNVDFDQAVAFGLGFGGLEAFFIGVQSFLNVLVFIMMPDLINQVPEAYKDIVSQQLSQSTWIVFAPMIERASTIVIHVFAALLVFYALRKAWKRYLWYSVGYKTIVDSIIPALTVYIGTQTIAGVYFIELFIIGFGIIGMGGVLWIKKIWSRNNA